MSKKAREFWIRLSSSEEGYRKPWHAITNVGTKNYWDEKAIHVREVVPCECDPEVGFFCAHCANENNYIQDLQNKLIEAQDEIKKLRLDLSDAQRLADYAEILTYLIEHNYTVIAGISTYWVAEIEGTRRVGEKCDTVKEAVEKFRRNNP